MLFCYTYVSNKRTNNNGCMNHRVPWTWFSYILHISACSADNINVISRVFSPFYLQVSSWYLSHRFIIMDDSDTAQTTHYKAWETPKYWTIITWLTGTNCQWKSLFHAPSFIRSLWYCVKLFKLLPWTEQISNIHKPPNVINNNYSKQSNHKNFILFFVWGSIIIITYIM